MPDAVAKTEFIPPPGVVFELCESTIGFVSRSLNMVLDYTPETLPVLDHYLRQVPLDVEGTIELVAVAAGVYFGEVARRSFGGTWQFDETKPHGTWRVDLPGRVSFAPVSYATSAILCEDATDDGELVVPQKMTAMVEAALEAKGEVRIDEYYSLSGRLEVLNYVVELCVANSAPASDPDPDADGDSD